jgi:DNA-binding transcriptional LysR family regulator
MSEAIEFRHLKYLLAIAEASNFTRAAQRLFVAQPSLSRQIRDLEEAIGFSIFDRHRDGVRLTPAGQMVIDYAQEAMSSRTQIVEVARAVNAGNVPTLRVGFSSFINARHLQNFRTSYNAFFPGCEIRPNSGTTAQIVAKLERRELDCALVPLPIHGPQWHIVQFSRTPLVACMRADDELAASSELDIETLASKLTIGRDPEAHPAAHARLLEMFSEVGYTTRISCLAVTPHDIQTLIREGYGVALVPDDSLMDADLTTRRIRGVDWTFDVALVHRTDAEHVALPFIAKMLLTPRRKKSPKRAETLPLRFDESA